MRIQTDTGYVALNLNSLSGNHDKPRMSVGSRAALAHHDTVELSSVTARQLPTGVIEHETPKFFFSTEVNASLDRVLTGKPPEVSKAAYHIIEFNMFNNHSDLSDEERAALLEVGLSQAKYLADNFMTENDASEFLDTIHLLAAVSKTRKVDPATGNVTYIELPQKPQGAPDDYVNPSKLMQRFDPESFRKLQAATANERGGILIQFVKKLRNHPDWVTQYQKEQDNLMTNVRNTPFDNRFKDASTTDLVQFVKQINERIENTSFSNKSFLTRNVASFALLLSNES